jgi:hypothetical protein
MEKSKTYTQEYAALWRRFIATIIDVAIFFALFYFGVKYIAPKAVSCGSGVSSMFCGVAYGLYTALVLAFIATIFNIIFRRTLGDILLNISYSTNSGKPVSRGKMFTLQILKYVFFGLSFYIIFENEIQYKIGPRLFTEPAYIATQEIVDDQKIYKNYFIPENAKIVPRSDYIRELEKYEKENKNYHGKIRILGMIISIIFSILLGYIYFIKYKSTGTTRFLYWMGIYPVRKKNEGKL